MDDASTDNNICGFSIAIHASCFSVLLLIFSFIEVGIGSIQKESVTGCLAPSMTGFVK